MKETYEEYINRTAEKDTDDYSTHSSVKKNYFPFTNQCPIDGNDCGLKSCEYKFYDNNRCYYFELERVMFEIFGTGDDFVSIHDYDSKNHIDWYIMVHGTYNLHYGERIDTGIEIRVSDGSWSVNRNVLEKNGIIDIFKFKKDENTKFYKSSFNNLHRVKKILEYINENKEEISKLFEEAYKCIKCGKSSVYSNTYNDKIICDGCQNNIVLKWVKNNG